VTTELQIAAARAALTRATNESVIRVCLTPRQAAKAIDGIDGVSRRTNGCRKCEGRIAELETLVRKLELQLKKRGK
jgi:hypothetical protein